HPSPASHRPFPFQSHRRALGITIVITELERVAVTWRSPAQRDADATKIAEVMTAPVTACAPETSVDECAAMMTANRIRHLPVVGAQGLSGVITIGDVLAFQVREQQSTIDYMHHFMFDLR